MAKYGDTIARLASAATPALRKLRRPSADRDETALRPSRLARVLDFVSDVGVLAFGTWTLIAYIGMATQARVSLLVPVWLATLPLLGGTLFVLNRRSGSISAPRAAPGRLDAGATGTGRRLLIASVAAGLGAAVLTAIAGSKLWALVWIGIFFPVAVALVRGDRLRSEESIAPPPAPAWPADAFAVLVGAVFAAMSLFTARTDGDDPFYVNRATGTAQLNRIPVRDIIFTEEEVAPVSGTGLPVDSFSALQGALGRFLDIHAASVAYYVTPPLMTFFATWALWRLLRGWAPRRVVLCFALGCAYWLFSAQTRLASGSFFLTRMWQGKVVFVAWLVLTIYVLLTRWLTRRDAVGALLLLAAAVSSIGMTGSAAFVAPLVFAAGAVSLLARRDWRGLPVVLAAAAIPIVVALVASQLYPLTHLAEEGRETRDLATSWYFHRVFGVGVLAAIGLVALWAAPWLARSGPAARAASGVTVVSLLLLAPWVLPTLNEVSGLGGTLRRILWVVPFPAVVGLLAAVPIVPLLGRRLARAPALSSRLVAAAPAVLVAGLLVVFGHPLWISLRGDSLWVRRPIWKTDQKALADTWTILDRYGGRDPILAEEAIMRAISLVTVQPKAVNARGFYARLTPEPPRRTNYRLALTRFVEGEDPKPARKKVERALADLQVGLVCVDESRPLVIRDVETIGYREAFHVRKFVCLQRPASLLATR